VTANIINIKDPKQKTPKAPPFVPKSNHVINIRSIDRRRVVCSEKQTRRLQEGMQKQPAMMPEIKSKCP
jgi:hypothetical protein